MITNHPARYRDPKTGLPYYNAYAYREIQRLRKGDYHWSKLLGAWVGSGTYAARGVPERFLHPEKESPNKKRLEEEKKKKLEEEEEGKKKKLEEGEEEEEEKKRKQAEGGEKKDDEPKPAAETEKPEAEKPEAEKPEEASSEAPKNEPVKPDAPPVKSEDAQPQTVPATTTADAAAQ